MNFSDADAAVTAAGFSSSAVINPQFCLPYPVDLAFTTKPPGEKKSGHLATIDAAGNVRFRSKESSLGGSTRLLDAAGHVLVRMKAKGRTMHDRWQVFAGDSKEQKDIVFSIKRSSVLQLHDEWFVYLAANKKEEACDFKITGSYSKKNYTIYRGDSSFVVAQLTKEHKLNLPLKKHAFGASISAGCDYSFVAALIAIFNVVYGTDQAIIMDSIIGSTAEAAAGTVAAAAAAAAASSG